MPRIYLTSNLQLTPNEDMQTAVQRIFHEVEDQINDGPAVVSLVDKNSKLPQGMTAGDPVFALADGVFKIGIFDGITVRWLNLGDISPTPSPSPTPTTTYYLLTSASGYYRTSTGGKFIITI